MWLSELTAAGVGGGGEKLKGRPKARHSDLKFSNQTEGGKAGHES